MAMSNANHIERIDPAAGIPGGEVVIECADHSENSAPTLNVWFQDKPAHVVAATRGRALVLVPDLGMGERKSKSQWLQTETRQVSGTVRGG